MLPPLSGQTWNPKGVRGAPSVLCLQVPPVPFVTFPHGESNWSNTLSLLLPEEIFKATLSTPHITENPLGINSALYCLMAYLSVMQLM